MDQGGVGEVRVGGGKPWGRKATRDLPVSLRPQV